MGKKEDFLREIPKEAADLLSIDYSETDGGWRLTPRRYLGKQFTVILNAVKKLGGRSIGYGRQLYFVIPDEKPTERSVKDIIQDIRRLIDELESRLQPA